MIRVVLDTNVLVSALAFPRSIPGKIYEDWKGGDFVLVVSDYILEELLRVFGREFASLEKVDIAQAVRAIRRQSFIVYPAEVKVRNLEDKDWPIIGTGISGNASFLVTGDKELLAVREFRNVRIVSPKDFYSRSDE